MPLLLCPNDNGPMQTLRRPGVEFDIYPTCRGVRLDRGALQKILTTARHDIAGDPSSDNHAPQQSGFVTRPPQRPRSVATGTTATTTVIAKRSVRASSMLRLHAGDVVVRDCGCSPESLGSAAGSHLNRRARARVQGTLIPIVVTFDQPCEVSAT